MTEPATPFQLIGRRPVLTPADLVDSLTPPPHFRDATFDTYVPDPAFPSQTAARDALTAFAQGLRRGRLNRLAPPSAGKGLYLDGGFGVGKTHLLAALAHRVGAGGAFGTFVEYTHLVGALGFSSAREALARFVVVCIDEFELDDPGDTLIMARLMRELTDAGVALVATSNTLPESLGQGRFAADDFRREIQTVASVFTTISIDGPDYRHRGSLVFETASEAEVEAIASDEAATVVPWSALLGELSHVHPSRMGAYVDGLPVLCLTGVAPLTDQNQALRVVTLVDRLYDRDIAVVASGYSMGEIFTPEMLRGGYRKKYFRALSRLAALSSAAPRRST